MHEVSKLSHAWILRYETCLYAPVEDFTAAGGMWRTMIASRHQQERWGVGWVRGTPPNSGGAMGVWRREVDPALQRTSWDLPDTWKWGKDTGELQTGVNS